MFGLKTNWGGHFYSNKEIDFRTKMRWTKTYDACVKLGILYIEFLVYPIRNKEKSCQDFIMFSVLERFSKFG